MYAALFYIMLVAFVPRQGAAYASPKLEMKLLCPQLYRRDFKGYVPKMNVSAGTYTEITEATSHKDCVYLCCANEDCNVAFITESKCFHISCISNQYCAPTMSSNLDVSMVLVRPTMGQNWEDVVDELGKMKHIICRSIRFKEVILCLYASQLLLI